MTEKRKLFNIKTGFNGEEVLNMLCDGVISEKDGGFKLSWDGSAQMGEEGIENSVEVYGNKTFIFRLGESSDGGMILENGITSVVSEFDSGSAQKIPIQFFVTELENSLSLDGGSVKLEYSISNPYSSAVSKRLEIDVL